jgi:hypothetical protein
MRSQVKLRPGVATRLLAEMRIWFSEGRVWSWRGVQGFFCFDRHF